MDNVVGGGDVADENAIVDNEDAVAMPAVMCVGDRSSQGLVWGRRIRGICAY